LQRIPIVYHPKMSKFDFGRGHPFRGARFESFMQLFHKTELDKNQLFEIIEPKTAEENDLEIVHDREYIELVKELEKKGGFLSMDTYVTPGMFEAAKLIVGAAMTAGRLVMTDKYDIAITFGGFHHAGVANGEGFCVFNDVAITTMMLLNDYKIKRILIIDTDAHQGNGTMDIFYNDPRVLFISIHQDPRTLYPGKGFVYEIGLGAGKGYTVNIPMPMFAGNEQYRYSLKEIFVPLAREFQPEVIIRNGGSDPHYTDQLTQLGLDLNGLNMVRKIVRKTVDETSKKLIDMTVSGYGDLTPYGWLAIIAGVSGLSINFEDVLSKNEQIEPPEKAYDEDSLQIKTQKTIEALKKELKAYWRCFR